MFNCFSLSGSFFRRICYEKSVMATYKNVLLHVRCYLIAIALLQMGGSLFIHSLRSQLVRRNTLLLLLSYNIFVVELEV